MEAEASEGDEVAVAEPLWSGDAEAVDGGAVAAAEVGEDAVEAIGGVDDGVMAGDVRAIEDDGVVGGAADAADAAGHNGEAAGLAGEVEFEVLQRQLAAVAGRHPSNDTAKRAVGQRS
jgi:hypothetical protein